MTGANPMRILIIDDEPDLSASLADYLEDQGFDVYTAVDGESGLRVFRETPVDAILVDLNMPKVDGYQVLEKVSVEAPDLPIIVISGAGLVDEAVRAIRMGAWDFVSKPVRDMAILEHTIRKAAERARLVRENRAYRENLEEQIRIRSSELVDAYEHLKQSQTEVDKLVLAMEQVQEEIVITNTDGVIEYVNQAFVKGTGYDRSEAIGQKPNILKSGKHPDRFYQEMWETILAGRVWSGRIVNKRKDDRLVLDDTVITPLVDSDGDIFGFCAVKRDITERIKTEEKLRQTQKLEAIGTMAGGIAHDFNNVLTIILGLTQVARRKMSPNYFPESELERVEDACYRAQELVGQILTFSRKSTPEMRGMDLVDSLRDALGLIRATAPKHIDITLETDVESAWISGNPTYIHQVLINLLTNAMQAISETGGGRITVNLGEDRDANGDSRFVLEVGDTGSGMDQETLDRIFDPFFTTKEQGKGTGLGLSVVHGIIEEHGGRISVESQPGEGTAFTVYLPKSHMDAPFVPSEREAPGDIPGNGHILLVDDQPDVLHAGAELMRALGYGVTEVADPKAAIDVVEKDLDAFDLVIVDRDMPGVSGLEVARHVFERAPKKPVIIATGYASQEYIVEAASLGIRQVIDKPFRISVLQSILAEALGPGTG
jgi:PAS domain S-box-containing protein